MQEEQQPETAVIDILEPDINEPGQTGVRLEQGVPRTHGGSEQVTAHRMD